VGNGRGFGGRAGLRTVLYWFKKGGNLGALGAKADPHKSSCRGYNDYEVGPFISSSNNVPR